mmetsp:Transcript_33202/g.87725  ORF Transcript_33202/g.87725 Transcript_33202/m.87725 type:complete len:117 (+) Transcript_33202:65-415(+)
MRGFARAAIALALIGVSAAFSPSIRRGRTVTIMMAADGRTSRRESMAALVGAAATATVGPLAAFAGEGRVSPKERREAMNNCKDGKVSHDGRATISPNANGSPIRPPRAVPEGERL